LLSTLDVTVLQDDRHYFPPYEAAIAVRRDSLAAHPSLRNALAELSGKLTDARMQKLNYQIDGQHRPLREVAQDFLRQAGLNQ
jgi:glycine betaine/choline ABC-type transport system substrate-binding protein